VSTEGRVHRTLALLVLLVGLACLAFSIVTPIGESPDEPAHLEYVRLYPRLDASLAASTLAGSYQGYELHQPPFYYFLASWWARATNAELAYPLSPNPEFPRSKKGGAFLSPPETAATAAGRAGIRSVRRLGLLFAAATVVALWQVARRESQGDEAVASLAAVPFILAPQLAFLCAVVSNDGLSFALCAWALLQQKKIHDGQESAFVCCLAGLATAAAPWAKASGFMLLPTLLLAGGALAAKKDWRKLGILLLPVVCGWVAWLAYRAERLAWFRQIAEDRGMGLWRDPSLLLDHPLRWLQVWVSYWAKLTWFQLHLPWPLYLFYLPATALVAGGLWLAWRQRSRFLVAPSGFWAVALLTNLALYACFILFFDYQLQGRLLYPSLAAAVGLAAGFLADLHRRRPLPGALLVWGPTVAIGTFFLLELAAIGVIISDEGWPRW
jgi:hypothetical protein